MSQKKNSKKKILAFGGLALLAFGSVGASLAYWAATVNGTSTDGSGNINIGEGGTVETTLSISEVSDNKDLRLVPAAFASGDNVASITITFNVNWKSTDAHGNGTIGTLTPVLNSASTAKCATDEDKAVVFNLLNCDFTSSTYSIIADDTNPTAVSATLTLDEPADKAQYDLIAGQDVALSFTFSVIA